MTLMPVVDRELELPSVRLVTIGAGIAAIGISCDGEGDYRRKRRRRRGRK